MMQEVRRSSYLGVTFGVFFIALAIAILIGILLNDWILFIPILLIEMGIYGIVIGSMARRRGETRGYGGISDASYFIFWSSLFTLIGLFWLINDVFPGIALYLILIILIFFGAAIILISLNRPRRA
jgi:ABC-type transport system involved in cytochrome c biogenesis permease subunit